MSALVLLALLGCSPKATETADTGEPAPDPVRLFSFAVITDSHMTGGGDNEANLEAVVQRANEEAEARDLELVFLLGDLAWGDGLADAPARFDALTVPWLPLLGDNEIHAGDEEAFDTTYTPQYDALAGELEGWSRAPTPVDDPETGAPAWFQDFAFTHQGVRFVGLDWCARVTGGLEGEMADLHDFAGGTLPWFEADLAANAPAEQGSVVMLSHHPMHLSPGAFLLDEMDALEERVTPYDVSIDADYAGHYHLDADETEADYGWDVHVTNSTWEDPPELRFVEVWSDTRRFTYVQEIVVVE